MLQTRQVLHWLLEHWEESVWALFWALIIWIASDLVSIDSRIRAIIRHIKNSFSELSVSYLRKRITKLEIYRETLRSHADKAVYLGTLHAIILVLVLMCIAALLIVADGMGLLEGGKFLACCILACTIGIGLATARYYALDTDTTRQFQRAITNIEKEMSALQEKLRKRTQ